MSTHHAAADHTRTGYAHSIDTRKPCRHGLAVDDATFSLSRVLESFCYGVHMTKREHRQLIASFVTLDDAITRAGNALAGGDLAVAERALAQAKQAVQTDAPALTIPEAADELDISRPTVRNWIDKNLLDAIPDSSPRRVSFASVQTLKERLSRLRAVAKDERRFSQLLRDAADQRALSQPGAREGLQDAIAGRSVEI
jgi:excisionase family DNA binding protein